MAVPKTFVDLAAAYNAMPDSFINIIGIVVDIMPSTTTAKGQYMLTFKLLDKRLQESVFGNQGLRVRFFKADAQSLPKVHQHGDVVLLRNIKMVSFNQQPVALSNYQTEVTVFPAASIPSPNFEIAYQGKQRLECLGVPLDVNKLSLEEQRYVIQLKNDMDSFVGSIPDNDSGSRLAVNFDRLPGNPSALAAGQKRPAVDLKGPDPKRSRFGPKFRLVRELQHRCFADICVQVVKKFPTHSGACELYVTDYTENKEMFFYSPPEEEDENERDGDTFGYSRAPKRAWPGPYSWLVLKVNLTDPHAHYANKTVEEGDFVLLRNVKIKVFNHLEGDMWPDSLNPEKIQINKLKDLDTPEIIAVLERKEKYWDARNTKLHQADQQEEKSRGLTKTEKKKQKKQRKAEQAAAKDSKSKGGKATVGAQNGTIEPPTKVDVNPHVRCSYEEVPISSIKDVVDSKNEIHAITKPMIYVLPFTNVKYRTLVRVVDYAPKQLEDFAIPELLNDDKSENSLIVDYESSPRYEWSFSLQIEDASISKAVSNTEDRIWVNVSHTDAQYLFGNGLDDPCDLRNNSLLLSKLREKLCILWGNLEEKSDEEQISNRPFECCVAEYGVQFEEGDPDMSSQAFGFQRMYSMFGVTIL